MKLKDLMRKCIPDDLYILEVVADQEDYVDAWYLFRDINWLDHERYDTLINSEVVIIHAGRHGLIVEIREPEV